MVYNWIFVIYYVNEEKKFEKIFLLSFVMYVFKDFI